MHHDFTDNYQMLSGGAIDPGLYSNNNAPRTNNLEVQNVMSKIPALKGTHFEDKFN